MRARTLLVLNVIGILVAITIFFVLLDPYLQTKNEATKIPPVQQQQGSTSTIEDYHSFENTMKRLNESQQLREFNIVN